MGLTGIVGPLIGSGIASRAGHPWAYFSLAAIFALAAIIQAIVHAWKGKQAGLA
jgi:hypothetical protein